MAKPKRIQIRPYARLLTMLGEQLISNERVALMELIKNAYDADSPWVNIDFKGFDEFYVHNDQSSIVIKDAGHGMTKKIIEKHLAHPATPEKKLRKKNSPKTPGGRIIQGEKGIGRFAILKLGRKITFITRAKDSDIEHVVDFDFTMYDDEFLTKNGKKEELYVDDLIINVSERKPEVFIKSKLPNSATPTSEHGTHIIISSLKGSWSKKKVENVYKDVARLQSLFDELVVIKRVKQKKDVFEVRIFKDESEQRFLQDDYQEKLLLLMTEKPVIRLENGEYDEKKKEFKFLLNGTTQIISLFDSSITGLRVFNKWFGDAAKKLKNRDTECGSFTFGFYVFDFRPSSKVSAKYLLDREDKNILKQHRIYLYRDGIRVFPYGEPDNDWLGTDIDRGTVSAAEFLSNDQVVGFVNISQENNPLLADQTNREGLLEHGNATEDFRTLLRTILRYIRKYQYKDYQAKNERKKAQDIVNNQQVKNDFETLKQSVEGNRKALDLILKAEKNYNTEKQYLIQRAETTEELAGVGLSVETASHDIMAIMSRSMNDLDYVIKEVRLGECHRDFLIKELQSIRGALSFVEAQLKDIQLLFKSSKQRRKKIRVKELVFKVQQIYKSLLKKESIDVEIKESKNPLIAKTTDAVLLQLLINLFDNSVYWLKQTDIKPKKIEILLDGQSGNMIFSDNGPGIRVDDKPYIFEPFFSGKGEEGRGLGLFIAKQLLERHDYFINLAELKSEHLLPGANFIINFIPEG